MKLRKGRSRYPMLPYSQIYGVVLWAGRGLGRTLKLVDVSDLPVSPVGYRGEPVRCAFFGGRVVFEPTPDKAYTVRIRFAPPIKEI
jgi:hypothetical protein